MTFSKKFDTIKATKKGSSSRNTDLKLLEENEKKRGKRK